MQMLILNATQAAQLAVLNSSGDPARQLAPITLTDNRQGLNRDLLADSGPGQTWSHYADLLNTLEEAEITAELPVTDLE